MGFVKKEAVFFLPFSNRGKSPAGYIRRAFPYTDKKSPRSGLFLFFFHFRSRLYYRSFQVGRQLLVTLKLHGKGTSSLSDGT